MQINTSGKPDEDAGAILHLSPEDNYLRKRSYVETNMSYKCKKDILLPYHYHNPYLSDKKYFLRTDSYWKILDRVLLLRVSGVNNYRGGRTNGALSTKSSLNFKQRQNNPCRTSIDNPFAPLSLADTPTPSIVSRPQSITGRSTYANIVQTNTVPGTPSPPRPQIRPSASKASLRPHPTPPPRPPVPPSASTASLRLKTPTTPKMIVQELAKGVQRFGTAIKRKSLTSGKAKKLSKAAQSVEQTEVKDPVQEADHERSEEQGRDISPTGLKGENSVQSNSWTHVVRRK